MKSSLREGGGGSPGSGGPALAGSPLFLLASILALSVAPAVVWSQVDTGEADFSRYVAIGDSYGAGVTNLSLHQDAQANSYPSLIERQATGSNAGFEQPLVSDPGIFGVLQLRSLSPLVIAPKPGLGSPINLTLPRPYDNLSVPGADTNDVVGRVTGDAAHDLVLRGIGTQLEQAAFLQPTFATIWIGGNDGLASVLSGMVIEDVTLTSLDRFGANYAQVVQTLSAVGTELAVGTIPHLMTEVPFASTLPPVVVNPATGEPVVIGGQTVPLLGPNGPLTGSDSVLLTAQGPLSRGIGIPTALGGTGQPLPDSVVLDASEKSTIQIRVNGYNNIVRALAAEVGAAVFDLDAWWTDLLEHGIAVGGLEYTAEFLTGGVFSLDGFHLTPIGYAFFANEVIKAINETYGAQIPQVNLADFVSGPAGAYPGGVAVPGATQARFTKKAIRNMRQVMGIPSPKKLRRLARRQGN